MIIFDGVDLEATCPWVRVEDVRVSQIESGHVTRPRAVAAGSHYVRERYGTRTVTVTFAVLTEDINQRQAAIACVSEWAKSDKEYRLDLPGHPDRYLMAVCTGKAEPSTRQWWESKLRLTFTCIDDPFWISAYEKSAACGTPFYVLGDAPPLMRIERSLSSAASNQSYGLNGNTISFSTIPAGNMVIDLNDQTARVGNTSIMPYYNVNSRFLIPKTGNQTVTGDGTVIYRERWQ